MPTLSKLASVSASNAIAFLFDLPMEKSPYSAIIGLNSFFTEKAIAISDQKDYFDACCHFAYEGWSTESIAYCVSVIAKLYYPAIYSLLDSKKKKALNKVQLDESVLTLMLTGDFPTKIISAQIDLFLLKSKKDQEQLIIKAISSEKETKIEFLFETSGVQSLVYYLSLQEPSTEEN